MAIGSLCRDIRVTNEAAKFVILFAKKGAEFRAAHTDRVEPLARKVCPDVRYLECCREPTADSGHYFLWRLGGRGHAKPEVCLSVLVSGFGDGGHVRQHLDPCPRDGGQ